MFFRMFQCLRKLIMFVLYTFLFPAIFKLFVLFFLQNSLSFLFWCLINQIMSEQKKLKGSQLSLYGEINRITNLFFYIKYESIILCCSFVSFVYTGKTSPMNIEDTCFDIDQASVNNMYLGNPKWSIYY